MASSSFPEKPRPLMLKDFLRDDLNCDSSFSGFRAFPRGETTVRCLLKVEFRNAKSIAARDRLLRRKTKSPLSTKIAAVLNAVRNLPFTSSFSSSSSYLKCRKQSILPKSFSRKLLSRSFWKKRVEEGTDRYYSLETSSSAISKSRVLIRDIIRLSSSSDETRGGKSMDAYLQLSYNSTAGGSSARNSCSCSSSSGWSENGENVSSSSGFDSVPSSSSPVSSEFTKKPVSPFREKRTTSILITANDADSPTGGVSGDRIATSNCRCGRKEEDNEMGIGAGTLECTCHQYEEKEQLSPVSVMDFPYEEEEEEEEEEEHKEEGHQPATGTPPSYHHSLVKIESTRHRLLVDPLDLRFAFEAEAEVEDQEVLCEEAEKDEVEALARELLEKVKSTNKCNSDYGDEMLLDFFIEGLLGYERKSLSRWRSEMRRGNEDRTVEEELLCAARNWVDGSGMVKGGGVELQIEEMKKDGRWRCFEEEEGETVADVENGLLGSLLDEILLDLVEV